VPRRFGYGPRPHRDDRIPHRPSFLLEGLTLTLSLDIWTVHIFPVMVHAPLGQIMKC
jgi:hypothetical protein